MCHPALNKFCMQCSLIAACSRSNVWTLTWLCATVSSERATSSLSGTGGNLLHSPNWTKCLSNSSHHSTIRLSVRQGVNIGFSLACFLLTISLLLLFSFPSSFSFSFLPVSEWHRGKITYRICSTRKTKVTSICTGCMHNVLYI